MSNLAADNQDKDDLEALFDEVAAKTAANAAAPARSAAKKDKVASADNREPEDLEALFDIIVAGETALPAVEEADRRSSANGPVAADEAVFNRLGHITRELHNALRELGLDKNLAKAANSIPDARDRLKYVASMTEQAAERVLNATDTMQPVLTRIGGDAQKLSIEWDSLLGRKLTVDQFRSLAERTHAYLRDAPAQTKSLNGHLMEIVLAQDFQDLTGQVIKKIMEVTEQMEKELVSLLIESAPVSARQDNALLNGPVIDATNRTDVVTTQDQVDDLLDSLGF
jgi:chemotaxis protein CheZ